MAQAWDAGVPDGYNSMIFSLQEAAKDVDEGNVGQSWRVIVDHDSPVHPGQGCEDALRQIYAEGRTQEQRIEYLTQALRQHDELEWVRPTDVEGFLCEYHKYVGIVDGRKSKPHQPKRAKPRSSVGYLDATGHLKSLPERLEVCKSFGLRTRGRTGVFCPPKSRTAARRALAGKSRGGQNSGFAGKSRGEAERIRKLKQVAACARWGTPCASSRALCGPRRGGA